MVVSGLMIYRAPGSLRVGPFSGLSIFRVNEVVVLCHPALFEWFIVVSPMYINCPFPMKLATVELTGSL